MKKNYQWARAAMMLLLVLFTSTAAWADEEFPVPEFSLNADGTSIQVQWNPGNAESWDIRYRRVAGEGQQQTRWVMLMDLHLSARSFIIENLRPKTEYEVQARANYNDGEDFSDWSPSQTITTGEDEYDGFDNLDDDENLCKECQKSDMAEAIYVLRAPKGGWYNFAVQIVDAVTGTEMAYLRSDETTDAGTIWLCCGRKYNINWIHDQEHAQINHSYAFSLIFEPGDEMYTMHLGEAPQRDALLTSFVMDCGEYCERRPMNLTVTDVTYKSIELTYTALTETDQIVYTTDPEANPDDLRCFEVQKDDKEEETTYMLDDLDPNTTYYIWVRSVCNGENGGFSRWTERLEVRTPGLNATPTQLQAKPKSKKAKLKWKKRGKEKRWKVKLRKQGKGVSVSESQIVTFGFGDGKGFNNTQFGGNVWSSKSSKKANENVLVVGGAHAGDVLTFGARQRENSADDAKFFVGSQKMDRTMKLDAQAQLFIQQKREAESQAGGGESAIDDMVYMAKTLMRFSRPVKGLPMQARKLAAVADEDEYFFYFRHNEESDLSHLSIEDLMLIPAENQSEWTVISNVTTTEYELKDLDPNTTYEVFVEPIYDDGTTGEGSPISVFTTLGEEAEPLAGAFSVGSGKQVYFSKGNLNYNSHNGGEWSFAEHQYDMRGEGNLVTIGNSTNLNDQVDLFCWSTPYNQFGTTGYIPTEASLEMIAGTPFTDWGDNPTLINTLGEGWQTLSKSEWNYLLAGRPNANERFAYAVVNQVNGIILLPDQWNTPEGVSLLTAADNGIAWYESFYASSDAGIAQINTYTADQWGKLEAAGAVFLPAANMIGTDDNGKLTMLDDFDSVGIYWSSTPSDIVDENNFHLFRAFVMLYAYTDNSFSLVPWTESFRFLGSAVRLVKPVPAPLLDLTLNEAADNSSLLASLDGQVCNVTLERTLTTTGYNTFAAPFYIDGATMAEKFGTDAKVKQLTGSSLADGTLTLTFADATCIEAGHPYLVKVSEQVVSPAFSEVTLSNVADVTTTAFADLVPTFGKTLVEGADGHENDAQSVLMLGANNKLYNPTVVYDANNQNSFIKGFRAYFRLHESASRARTVVMDLGDGKTTNIPVTEAATQGEANGQSEWFGIDGRRLLQKPTKSGAYIERINKQTNTVIIQ